MYEPYLPFLYSLFGKKRDTQEDKKRSMKMEIIVAGEIELRIYYAINGFIVTGLSFDICYRLMLEYKSCITLKIISCLHNTDL